MRQAPEPGASLNFGSLGEVRRNRDLSAPTRAELLYYNTDGVGNDGSQWNNYWTGVGKAAIACGHRWVLAEGPNTGAASIQDEIDGSRPILADYSPLAVPNWLYTRGRLSMAIIRRSTRNIRLSSTGELQGNDGEMETLLLIRRGWTGFGEQFARGGWFIFDADDSLVDDGNWERTKGEVPFFPLFYERLKSDAIPDQSFFTVRPTSMLPNPSVTPAISRSGVTEMGNAAVGYMNLASAADFDAIDGASSVQAIAGVDEAGFNVFVEKIKAGNRFAPLPASGDTNNAKIIDASTGVVVADVFDRRLAAKRQEAVELMLNEMEAAPYASGESKKVSFTDAKAPRLANFAQEMENAQNTAIYFLECLWTLEKPSGAVKWPKQFDLLDVIRAVTDYFNMQALSGLSSPTADGAAMFMAAKKLGLVGDDETSAKVQAEYTASATQKQASEKALNDAKVKQLTAPKPAPVTGAKKKKA
jgi:hypothetical protein